MPRKEHCYHYLYKTTNLINNRYYYGMHSTSNLEDDYLGSGLKLRRAVRKYGKENFKREILEMFDSREELVQGEIELITEDLLNDPMCMNLKLGGEGGWPILSGEDHWFYGKIRTPKHIQAMKNGYNNWLNDTIKFELSKERIKLGIKNFYLNGGKNSFEGKKHSETTKKKMSESSTGMCVGEKNGSYATCWVFKNGESKKIKKEKLTQYLSNGWIKKRQLDKQAKEKNSQFGTCWITRDNENKKIKKEELEAFILQGWSKGRKTK